MHPSKIHIKSSPVFLGMEFIETPSFCCSTVEVALEVVAVEGGVVDATVVGCAAAADEAAVATTTICAVLAVDDAAQLFDVMMVLLLPVLLLPPVNA